jgi:hypothetical protein
MTSLGLHKMRPLAAQSDLGRVIATQGLTSGRAMKAVGPPS